MRHVILLIILTVCQCRQPMLRETDESDGSAVGLSLLRQSQLKWVQMDAAAASAGGPETTTASPLAQPDSTGLVGGLLDGRPLLALNLWANQRRAQLKPRRRDMHEASLLKLLGADYQPGWMRRSREGGSQVSTLPHRSMTLH